MGKTRHVLTAQVALAALIAGLFPVTPVFALDFTASNPGADVSSANPAYDPTMPAAYNAATIGAQGQLFNSCNGSLQSGISASINDLAKLTGGQSAQSRPAPAGGTGINAVCNGSPEGPSADSISCENLAPNGIKNEQAFKVKQTAINNALANVQCRKNKFEAIKGELNCLTTQADMLSQQLSSIQSSYQSNIQRYGQDLQKVNQVLADRESQDKDVLTRLNGGGEGGSGSKGLIAVRDGICQALTGAPCGSTGGQAVVDPANSIPGQIQKLKDDMTDMDNAQKALGEAIQQRTMGIAGECFSQRKLDNLRCSNAVQGVGGSNLDSDGYPVGPVSAEQYIVCMYKQKLGVNMKTGVVEDTKGTIRGNNAVNRASGLESLLNSILGDVPQKAQPQANGQPPDPSSIQAATLLTAADVESQYGSALEKYNDAGVNVHDEAIQAMSYCFQRASNVVDTEKNMASSPLGQQKALIKKKQDGLKTTANQMLSANAQKFEEAMGALTQMSMPLGIGASCTSGTPDVQVSCLQDLQNNMEALLHGSAKQSTINMYIKGTDPKTTIQFSCQGLNGCITALQNVDRNLKIEHQRVTTFKQSYVTAAKQSTENFTKQMAQMMSGQSAALTNRLKSLNSALVSMGVSGSGITIPKVAGEAQKFDGDGLPVPPSSALQLIGGQMNPPMLDVSGNDFSSALGSVGDGVKDLDSKVTPLQEAENKLASLPMICANKTAESRLSSLQTNAAKITDGNCGWSEQFCRQASSVSNLGGTLSGMDGIGISPEAISNVDSSLDAGLSGCAEREAYSKKRASYVKEHDAWQERKTKFLDNNKNATFSEAEPKEPSTSEGTLAPPSPAAYCSGLTSRIKGDFDGIRRVHNSLGDSFSGSAED